MRGLRFAAALLLAGMAALPAAAMELQMPGEATLTRQIVTGPDSYPLPTGAFSDGTLPTRTVEGAVVRQAWRIDGDGMTTLQILRPLRDQLDEMGFSVVFECQDAGCGGFDFRFGVQVISAPEMFVDLFDFRFLSARRGTGEQAEYVTLLVSRSGNTGYVQLVHVGPETAEPLPVAPAGVAPAPDATETAVARALEETGHVILSDLDFGTGATALGDGPFESLEALANYLRNNPDRRVALVGHTDSVGRLEANTELSQRRAAAVLERLVAAHDVPRAQLDAQGVAYLAPVAPNLTQAGRDANRRVEAVLLDSE